MEDFNTHQITEKTRKFEPNEIFIEERINVSKGRKISALDHNLRAAFSDYLIRVEEPKKPSVLGTLTMVIGAFGVFSYSDLIAQKKWLPVEASFSIGGGIFAVVISLSLLRWINYQKTLRFFNENKGIDSFEEALKKLRGQADAGGSTLTAPVQKLQ